MMYERKPYVMIRRARALAGAWHRHQRRPNVTKDRFFTHVKEVAELVGEAGGDLHEVVAAYLHDILEDTQIGPHTIRERFGARVASLVDELTDRPEWKDLPTLVRKRTQARAMRVVSRSAKLVKLADQIVNVRSIASDTQTLENSRKIREYLIGARAVVRACASVSPELTELFEKEYRNACTSHGIRYRKTMT